MYYIVLAFKGLIGKGSYHPNTVYKRFNREYFWRTLRSKFKRNGVSLQNNFPVWRLWSVALFFLLLMLSGYLSAWQVCWLLLLLMLLLMVVVVVVVMMMMVICR